MKYSQLDKPVKTVINVRDNEVTVSMLHIKETAPLDEQGNSLKDLSSAFPKIKEYFGQATVLQLDSIIYDALTDGQPVDEPLQKLTNFTYELYI